MKRILLFCFVASLAFSVNGQNTDDLTGAQILRATRAIYDQGRLHELPVILEAAVKRHGSKALSTSEKIEAYKLLILTYIYLEEPQKADAKMTELLRTDHFFEVSDSDPIEFKSLYNKFRSWPLFRIGFRAGLNQAFINTKTVYSITAEGIGKGTYTPSIGFQGVATFEKDLKKFLNGNFTLAPEIGYAKQSFTYKNTGIFHIDSINKDAEANHKILRTVIQANLLTQYKLGKSGANFHVILGPSVGYLASSIFQGQFNIESKENITGQKVDNTVNYNRIMVSVIAGAGVKFKIGGIYLTADARFQYGLMNAVNTKQRYKWDTPELRDLATQYSYIDNDFSINQAMFNIGLIYPYFNPKKLIK